jgi:hypothetical protein
MPNPAPPPPPINPDQDSVKFGKFVGLKNTVDAERLGPDELAHAVNIDLDDVGQIHRRRGRTQVAAGLYRSLFTSNENIVYALCNGVLGIVNPDFSFVPLQSALDPSDDVAYVQVGDQIYFSSSSVAGIISQRARTVAPWGTADFWYSPVIDPTHTLPPIRGRILGAPPFARTMAYWNGRIYLGHKRLVWATELYNYNFVDKTKNFWQFEGEIVFIGSVTDGLYIGTTEGVWFVSGVFSAAKRVRVMDSPAIRGSLVYVPGELANPAQIGLDVEQPAKVSILFLTEEGYCGGQDGGVCYNYTEQRMIFPGIQKAAAMFRRQDGVNQYVVSAQSGGDPISNARIGDYVDVTLRRAGTWREVTDRVGFVDSISATVIPA